MLTSFTSTCELTEMSFCTAFGTATHHGAQLQFVVLIYIGFIVAVWSHVIQYIALSYQNYHP